MVQLRVIATVELKSLAGSVASGAVGVEAVVEEARVSALPMVLSTGILVVRLVVAPIVPSVTALVLLLLVLNEVSVDAMIVLEFPAFSDPAVVVGIAEEKSPLVVAALPCSELLILRTVPCSHRRRRTREN